MNKFIKKLLSVVLVLFCFLIGIIIGNSNSKTELKANLDKEYASEQTTLQDTKNELSETNTKISDLKDQISDLNNYIKENSK